jgi:hypothetical protein
VWEKIYPHYIEEQSLTATAGDIAEFVAYHTEFERKDRLQRARKLEELNGRLAAGDLGSDERLRLEEFRKILVRMAERDAQSELVPADSPRNYAPWIEFWKANGALYRQYGGTVAATASGPVAHGARAFCGLVHHRAQRHQVPRVLVLTKGGVVTEAQSRQIDVDECR